MSIEFILIGVLYVTGVFLSLRRELRSLYSQFPHFSKKHIIRTLVRHEFNLFVIYGLGLLLIQGVWILKIETHTHFSIEGSIVAFALLFGFGYLWGQFSYALCAVTPSTMEIKEMFRGELNMEYQND